MTNTALPPALRAVPSFSRAIGLASGVSDERLHRRRLSRVTHGWYRIGSCSEVVDRCVALAECLPPDAVFSDLTAAQLWRLPLPAELTESAAPVHVTVTPRPTVPQRRELVVHRRNGVVAVAGPAELAVTSAEQTFLDLAMSLPLEALAVVGDAALHGGITSLERLSDALRAARRRRGLGLCRLVLPLLDGRAQSPPETLLRLRLAAAGFSVEPQCAVADANGLVIGHVDLGLRRYRIAVEYEGRQHAEGEQFDYDIDRYSALAAAGWLVIRCGRRDLAGGSALLVRRVRAAAATR